MALHWQCGCHATERQGGWGGSVRQSVGILVLGVELGAEVLAPIFQVEGYACVGLLGGAVPRAGSGASAGAEREEEAGDGGEGKVRAGKAACVPVHRGSAGVHRVHRRCARVLRFLFSFFPCPVRICGLVDLATGPLFRFELCRNL